MHTKHLELKANNLTLQIFINNDDIQGAGVCGYAGVVSTTGSTISKAANGAAATVVSVSRLSTVLFGLALGFVFISL